MKQYQIRVVEEHAALNTKIELLEAFVGTSQYHALDQHDQFLLRKQLLAMREYATVLSERIGRFDLANG